MNDSTFIQSQALANKFRVLGLPHALSVSLSREIMKWFTKSGPEWTVTRLKAMKQRLISFTSGEQYVGAWDGIASRKTDSRIPRGPFGVLFRPKWAETHFKTAFQCLNCYNAIVSAEVTKKQWLKFQSSVERSIEIQTQEPGQFQRLLGFESTSLPSASVEDVLSVLRDQIPRRIRLPRPGRVLSIPEYPVSMERSTPNVEGRSIPEPFWLDTLCVLWRHDVGIELFSRYQQVALALGPLLDVVVKDYMPGVPCAVPKTNTPKPLRMVFSPREEAGSTGFVGRISFLQEPGFKLRAIANPFRIYQLALSRLAKQLFRTLKTLPWDCTFDQSKADEVIQQHLVEGQLVSCFDLSDATNNAPLGDQLFLLRTLGCNPDDVHLFQEISEGPWLVRDPLEGWRTMKWTVGQPLGLLPSFASFALWHGLVLRAIELTLGKRQRTFYVLGDDVVILDREVAYLYAQMMHHYNVPISAPKCTFSTRVASFAGKLFTRKEQHYSLRWKTPSDRSFVDIARCLGPRSLCLFTSRQRRVLKAIAPFPEPYGLGWNPKGLTLSERMSEMPSALWEEAEELIPLRPLMDGLVDLTENSVLFPMHRLMNDPLVREWFQQDARDRPDPLSCLTRDRIIVSNNIKHDVFSPDDESIFSKIWRPFMRVDSDPRGLTTLDVLERKLGYSIKK